MKAIKLLLITLTFLNFILISCASKDNPVEQQEQTTSSETSKIIASTLSSKIGTSSFDETSTDLNSYLEYDFCFNFVYPVTISYNNGTIVVIENAEQFLTVLTTMTDALYINGIAFPFDIITPTGTQTITDETEFLNAINSCDTDDDSTPNYEDSDDDNDGIADADEDTNNDGNETNDDTDGDNIPDYQDTDDDGDGVDTADEDVDNDGNPANDDTDNDGTPNYQDTDDDGDGVDTADEDNDHNGDVADDDSDDDGTPDYLDTDSDNDGVEDGDDDDADGDGQNDDEEDDNSGDDNGDDDNDDNGDNG